ncbi:MAG: hypothetical protein JWN83_2035 [Chitinophagaceae bacterium]|nr:hypothetical protein [Chitinophagaceae bacterium]
MKTLITLFFYFFISNAFAQLEITTGYATEKHLSDGPALQFAYDYKIKNRLYTKPQIGYKYLYYYNDFVGATLKISILEFHQTLSYEVIKKKKYIFKPNIGINYRFYHWRGEMSLPHNRLPQRAWTIGLRNQQYFILNSFDGIYTNEYNVNNLGFSFQLQNQFKLNDKIWLHITPFMEPNYDGSQNTGGCYVGIIFKNQK